LAKIVLIVGMVIYLVGYVLAIIATERIESADYDDFETIADMVKWSGYLEGGGFLALFAGVVGIAAGLAQSNRNQ